MLLQGKHKWNGFKSLQTTLAGSDSVKEILGSKHQNRGDILSKVISQLRLAEYVETSANQILSTKLP